MADEFYVPTYFHAQTDKNYQFSDMTEKECNELSTKFSNFYEWTYNFYNKLLERGVAKEQARLVLPLGTYTQFYWTVNARSLMNFFKLRLANHAQWEIQQYAKAMLDYFSLKLPWTTEAFLKKEFPKLLNKT